MNKSIRRLATAFLILYGLLFIQINRVQIYDAKRLIEDPTNPRVAIEAFGASRGRIATSDGVIIATSKINDLSDQFRYEREYPYGDLYAHITGYTSFNSGSSGLELTYSEELSGRTPEQLADNLYELFASDPETHDLVLTIQHDLQTVAAESLGSRNGAVVVMSPLTGEIFALVSSPTFDPNLLSSTNTTTANNVRSDLLNQINTPLISRATSEIYAPGSTFKLITATAAIEQVNFTLENPVFDITDAYIPPLTIRPITNYGGSECGGSLKEILRVSCNTAFAEIGAEYIGPSLLQETAERFGFNETIPFDVPTATSYFPTDFGKELSVVTTPEGESTGIPIVENTPLLAQAAIGQYEVAATPLQMALVASAIAGQGNTPSPYLVKEILNHKGELVTRTLNSIWQQTMEASTAELLREGMKEIVDSGTAQRLAINGLIIGAKTGTAQISSDEIATHAWVLGFAGYPESLPSVAFTVFVEADSAEGEQTGGRTAAPIAREILVQFFEINE
ncbi:MAG TPA: penicillin-binding protein 2 [Acidimicrobiales bacterium]|nr:penicillin-binding protein 2 [Acidimicrobiales bacterium]